MRLNCGHCAPAYFALVALLALSGNIALAGPATVQFPLDLLNSQRQPGRATVHHDTNGPAVGLAPGRHSEQMSERVAHRVFSREILVRSATGKISCRYMLPSSRSIW